MQTSGDVLKVFEGLTREQVRELRRRILETLPELRREVMEGGQKTNKKGDKESPEPLQARK